MRDVLTIEKFTQGIITTLDEADLPIDASGFSTDVENESPLGILQGRRGDATHSSVYGLGVNDAVFYDNSDGKVDGVFLHSGSVSLVHDFYGSPVEEPINTVAVSSSSQLILRGDEIRYLPGAESVPYWIGKDRSGKVITEPTRLKPPIGLPFFYYTYFDGTYLYGMEFNGNCIYKVTINTGVVTLVEKTSDGVLSGITAMCEDKSPSKLWVLDQTSPYGTLHRIDMATMDIDFSCELNDWGNEVGREVPFKITSMLHNNSYLWFAVSSYPYPTSTPSLTQPLVLNISAPSGMGSITLANRTPRLRFSEISDYPFITYDDPPVVGEWVYQYQQGSVGTEKWPADQIPTRLYGSSLFTVDGTTVGWALGVKKWDGKYSDYHPNFHITGRKEFIRGPFYYSLDGSSNPVCTSCEMIAYFLVATSTANGPARIVRLNIPDPGASTIPSFVDHSGVVYNEATKLYAGTNNGSSISHWSFAPGDIPALVSTSSNPMTEAATTAALATPQRLCHYYSTNTSIYTISREDSRKWEVNRLEESSISTIVSVCTASAIALSHSVITTGGEVFTSPYQYYKASLIYDTQQEGPLSPVILKVTGAGDIAEKRARILTITLKSQYLSSRVSGIAIYRAGGDLMETTPSELYRCILSISFKDSGWSDTTGTYVRTYLDNVEDVGQTYEARTGIPETEDEPFIDYGIGCVVNDALFVGQCRHPSLPDSLYFIMKSKIGRFDMFNWAEEYNRIQFIPKALANFAGRLWIFDENTLLKIQPDSFFVEEVYEGVGASSQNDVAVSEQGMFFRNERTVFWHNGQEITPIGDLIRHTDLSTYRALEDITELQFKTKMVYDGTLRSLVIFGDFGTEPGSFDLGLFVFRPDAKRWDYWTIPTPSTTVAGLFLGKRGEIFWSTALTLYRIASSATRKSFTWYSKLLTFTNSNSKKKIYDINPITEGTVVTEYQMDDGTWEVGPEIKSADRLARRMRIRMSGSGLVRGLGVIWRKLEGQR